MDSNGDGIITTRESTAYALSPSALCGDAVYSYRFGKYDTAADGSWSSAEFDAYTAAYGGSGTFSVVSGGDGSTISESEYTSYAKSANGLPTCAWRLSKYDADGNNQWSQAEFDAYKLDYGGSATFSDVDSSQGEIGRAHV